jgi:nicotinamide-nucleotide amidase
VKIDSEIFPAMNDPVLEQLAVKAGDRLRKGQLLLATGESCTGGMVAAAITDISGSSQWFERGFVTYSNQAKIDMLGVPAELLHKHGAVSEAVAKAMAEGALLNSRAQVSLAITGIAGPGGGTPDKLVGMVCFAWSNRLTTLTETQYFKGDRTRVRVQAAQHALRGLLKLLDTAEK